MCSTGGGELLKPPPEAAFLITGADRMPHAGGYQR